MRGRILMLQQIKYKIRIAKDSCQGRNTTDQDQQKSEELRSCFPSILVILVSFELQWDIV